MTYSKVQLQSMIHHMRSTSNDFYGAAVDIGNHPFIEFTGLINEYIDCCQQALNKGVDFTECSTHSGKELPMMDHQVKYTNEKLECIFTGRSVMEEK